MGNFYQQYVKKYFGWRNWAVFYYNSIIENIFLFFFIALVIEDFSNEFLLKTVCFVGFSLLSTTFGYLINDFADRELDKRHGKPNTFEKDSSLRAVLVLVIIFLLSVVFSIPFWEKTGFLLLWGAWLFLASFYSLPPLRFKEKGKLGLVLVVLAQRVIPSIIVFAAFDFWQIPDSLILLNYFVVKGFASDVNHQLQDYINDVKTGTRTSAVELGIEKLEKYFRFILRYERIGLLLVVGLIWIRLSYLNVWENLIIQFLMVLFFIIFSLSWWLDWKAQGAIARINPFKSQQRDIFQFLHLAFPHVVLPFVLLMILIAKNFYYLMFLIILGAIYQIFNFNKIKLILGSWKELLKEIKDSR